MVLDGCSRCDDNGSMLQSHKSKKTLTEKDKPTYEIDKFLELLRIVKIVIMVKIVKIFQNL